MQRLKEKLTVGLISLGCDKNRVDSEKMLGALKDEFNISNDVSCCQVLILNTCAFLAESRKEAIDTLFEYTELKKHGLEKIIMTGCLPQKFITELYDELPEVDAFLGTFDYDLINYAIKELYLSGKRLNLVGKGNELKKVRLKTTAPHFAYLKIADGCNNHCTYCLIPKIRGRYKSYPIEELVSEAESLGDIKELILVAQDTTRYGEDLYGENRFIQLIRSLSALKNVGSIRLLYCYPEMISDELIAELKNNDKLLKYVDIPLQHASDRILKLMNRKGSFNSYIELINKLKAEVENIAIRSTFITGFPSETEEDHKILLEFLNKAKLFNAGFFAYSKEPDTPAYKLKGHVDKRTKLKRQKELYALQTAISAENLKRFVGKTVKAVCDGIDYDKQSFFARAYFNAPDVDGKIYVKSEEIIEQGKCYEVRITDSSDFDLYGEIINELT